MGMLSELTLQNSVFFFRLASFLKSVPIKLSVPGSLSVQPFQTRWKTWVWYLVSMTVLASSLYQILSFFWGVHAQGLTSETAVHVFYFVIARLAMLFFIPMLLMREKAVAMINQLDLVSEISRSKAPQWLLVLTLGESSNDY